MTVLVGLCLLILYVLIACVRYKGIPPSISDTFYPPASMGYMFTIVLFIVGTLCTMGLLELSDGSDFQFVSFLTGGGIMLVGAAPLFKGSDKVMHYTGAVTLLVGSQLWIVLFGNALTLFLWCSLYPLCYIRSSSKMLWIELLCVITIMLSILCV